MVNSKNAFWQALILAILVFGLGLIAGFFLESYRSDSVQNVLLGSEVNVLDEQLRERVIDNFNISCILVEEDLVGFADRIYHDAQKLELYDGSAKFSDSLLILHKRYDLLRTYLWSESVKHKDNCGSKIVTVVYIYNYKTEDDEKKARQGFYSRILLELKNKYPEKVLLIPIARDMDLSSLNLILDRYGVSESPAIIINEDKIISNIVTFDELEKAILDSNKE
ncbi:hypothetical protein COU54_03465 [Candidatus Pacearchaeota archaeon CG10_big_fil_rev_8_21_14_0_10_31_24]|nr:MAG: hypothetical protein COU54_03465 [Candidatus Pacearchaeota archaeon CG10_big_fil_rev_8_21_14_0_10_31_24]